MFAAGGQESVPDDIGIHSPARPYLFVNIDSLHGAEGTFGVRRLVAAMSARELPQSGGLPPGMSLHA
jgi:hypothetical protein